MHRRVVREAIGQFRSDIVMPAARRPPLAAATACDEDGNVYEADGITNATALADAVAHARERVRTNAQHWEGLLGAMEWSARRAKSKGATTVYAEIEVEMEEAEEDHSHPVPPTTAGAMAVHAQSQSDEEMAMARMRPAAAASRTSMALLPTALPNDEHAGAEDVSDSAAATQDDVLTAAQARPRRESRGVQRFVASAAPPPRIAHAAAKRGATEGVSPSEAADAVFVRRARLQAAAGAPTWIMFEPPAAADSITSSSANSGDFQYILGGQYILHNTERLDQINSVLRDWQTGGDGSLVAPPSDETSEQTQRERAAQASRTLAGRAEKRQRARPQLEEPVIRQPDSHAATRETGIRRAAR